jgi:hypothetical protein
VDPHVSDGQKFSTITLHTIIYDPLSIMSTTSPTYPLFSLDILPSSDRSRWDLSISIGSSVDQYVSDNQNCYTIIIYTLYNTEKRRVTKSSRVQCEIPEIV